MLVTYKYSFQSVRISLTPSAVSEMRSSAMAFSPSLSASTDLRRLAGTDFVRLSAMDHRDGRSSTLSFSNCSHRQSKPISLKRIGWISGVSEGFVVRATSEITGEAERPESKSFVNTLALVMLIGLWYFFNIYFNIFNKQVLEAFHFPVTVSLFQFAVGTILVTFMWTFNLYKRPKITGAQLVSILPLAVMHTLGNLGLNMSLGKVAVSFTHTVKALEPFFTVVLSAIFLGEFPTALVASSLLPIVGGVALASMTEISFNWAGFWSAMGSNLTNQSRNVLSKGLMVEGEDSLDDINLFSVITIMSFILNVPIMLFMEGIKFTPSYLHAAGLNATEIYTLALWAALCFHAYQQVSYMLLQRMSPVTHSVANCVKRVVVIVSSILFFHTPVLPTNAIGTGIALAGVFLYSRAKRIKPRSKTD